MRHPWAALAECCEFLDHIRRPVKESDRVDGPYPYFGANGQQGWINDYLFDEPLVLLAEDGGHFSNPERGIAYKINGKTWVNNHAHVLRPREGVIDVDYLAHALKNKDVRRHLSGSTRDKLTKAGACQIEIPLPPLEDQRRIAAILDKSHSIQGLLLQRHRMLQALINSMLISDFGSPTEWPLKWKMQKLGDCCECLDRYRRPVKESERQEGHIPYYGANGQQGWIDDFLFDESLVLVAEDGGHFADRRRGVAYRIDGKAWVNNHAHILRPRGNDLEVEFLHRILRHYDFVPYISGSTRSKLTQGQLNEVPIPVPPVDSQRSFSRCVERLVSSLGTSSRSLKAAESLSRSLAQSILESEK